MQRKMGIDYGDRRIGIAMTDSLCIISSPFEVYQNKGVEDAVKHIVDLVKQYNVGEIAMGLPVNMDGTEGERALLHREIGKQISEVAGVQEAGGTGL